jgi:O-antigen ligase
LLDEPTVIQRFADLRNPLFWDKILVACVALHVLGLFLPTMTAVQNLGLYGALSISLFDRRWRVCLSYLTHPLLLFAGSLIAWFALSSVWSVDPATTLKSTTSVFKDYVLVVPPLVYLLTDAGLRRLFGQALALSGLVIVALNGVQYVNELLLDPALLANIKLHRGWGHPLIYFLPFALMQVRASRGRASAVWFALFLVEVLMIIGTGARGAWLALIAAVALWSVLDFDRRWLIRIAIGGAALAFAAYALLPASVVRDKATQGMDTSMRTTGTWGPALQMIGERPVLGFGFGKEIFNREFDRRAAEEPTWTIRKSKGPHSIYLEAGFSGGYPALFGVVVLFAAVLGFGIRGVVRAGTTEDRLAALAATAAFLAFYITRGAVESVRWGPLIVLLLMIVYHSASRRRPETSPASNQQA